MLYLALNSECHLLTTEYGIQNIIVQEQFLDKDRESVNHLENARENKEDSAFPFPSGEDRSDHIGEDAGVDSKNDAASRARIKTLFSEMDVS